MSDELKPADEDALLEALVAAEEAATEPEAEPEPEAPSPQAEFERLLAAGYRHADLEVITGPDGTLRSVGVAKNA